MSLFQKAIETYDNMQHLAGVKQEGTLTLAPIGFMSTKAHIIITLDLDGNFIRAENTDKTNENIIIPVTEKSSGRSGTGAKSTPHPLCERLEYLIPKNSISFEAYKNQLEKWASSCDIPALTAVLNYINGKTIENDLKDIKYDEKNIVCWRVLNSGEKDEVWENREIQESYLNYYTQSKSENKHSLCYITGKDSIVAEQHLKGVYSQCGNAKIISSNDTKNFTYLGRFIASDEAVTISYEASQKAHNALKWVIGNDGVTFGNKRFVSWNPHGIKIPKPTNSLLSFSNEDEKHPTPTSYKKKLAKIIAGYKANMQFDDEAIIAVFSAATSGRLSVTYYNEISGSDFLEHMKKWEETCCFYSSQFGTSSPSLKSIVNAAFGIQRNNKIETDEKIIGEQIYRLLLCKINGVLFPHDIMRYAVEKCGNMQILEKANRGNQLFTTCAIIRKYIYDHKKEELNMALEPKRKDRSYQYGRLLAVLEKAERDTYGQTEKRETNAIRLQSVFVKRPAYATRIILEQVKTAYYPQLSIGARTFYEKIIGEIMTVISESDESEINRPLGETYLIGYYLQKNEFYTKKETKTETEEK